MNIQDKASLVTRKGTEGIAARAAVIASAGSIEAAREAGLLPKLVELSLSEAVVLALLKQGTRKYLAIFGHGSTDLAEILRIYEEEGVTRTFNFRNEVALLHKSGFERGFPFPGRTYPTATVTGMPSAV